MRLRSCLLALRMLLGFGLLLRALPRRRPWLSMLLTGLSCRLGGTLLRSRRLHMLRLRPLLLLPLLLMNIAVRLSRMLLGG
jgi:hypothetical protein